MWEGKFEFIDEFDLFEWMKIEEKYVKNVLCEVQKVSKSSFEDFMMN